MTKRYRISLEVVCEVKEKVRGYGSRESLDFTQEIIDSLLSRPEVLNWYYKYHIPEIMLEGIIESIYPENFDRQKMYNLFWKKLKEVVKPEVKFYIEEKIFGKTRELGPCGSLVVDLNSNLLFNQLHNYGLTGLTLEEIGPLKRREGGSPVKLIELNPEEPFQVENFPVARGEGFF